MIKKIFNYSFTFLRTNFIRPHTLYWKHKKTLAKNLEIKNSAKGKRCFILGTGPSLNLFDLKRLSNEETFVVNNFWRHPQYKECNPKYYVVLDPSFFPDDKQNKSSYMTDDMLKRNNTVSSLTTTFFYNIKGKEFVTQNNLYDDHRIYYLCQNGFFKTDLKFNIDISKVIPDVKNVVLGALIIAAYMGFEEIYLLGCDHDFLAHPNFYEGFKHFYEEKKYNLEDKNEVGYYKLNIMSYENAIDSYRLTFRNYRLFKEKLARINPNVKIYNATPNSFLDVFPFIKYEEIKF